MVPGPFDVMWGTRSRIVASWCAECYTAGLQEEKEKRHLDFLISARPWKCLFMIFIVNVCLIFRGVFGFRALNFERRMVVGPIWNASCFGDYFRKVHGFKSRWTSEPSFAQERWQGMTQNYCFCPGEESWPWFWLNKNYVNPIVT